MCGTCGRIWETAIAMNLVGAPHVHELLPGSDHNRTHCDNGRPIETMNYYFIEQPRTGQIYSFSVPTES